jgi:two-component system response regulator
MVPFWSQVMNNRPILLVEDNPDDVAFTLRAFKKNNISNEIVVAPNGEEALNLLLPANDSPALRPALVLLDVKLPKVGGMEVLRRIRDDPRTELLPVIVLTTSSEETDMVNSYRLGANSFVRKPVVFGDFIQAASVLGVYWLAINQPVPKWRREDWA